MCIVMNAYFGVVALAFTWVYLVGDGLDREVEQIKRASHGGRRYSVFRYGLGHLRGLLLNPTGQQRVFRRTLRFLSCTRWLISTPQLYLCLCLKQVWFKSKRDRLPRHVEYDVPE